MSTEEDCLDSDPRQLEYARTLALPQALSLDLSPVALTLVLGNDPLIPLCGGGEDPVQRLTSSVAQRLLVDLCNIKVVLALPLQSVHGTENAADAFQAWLSWSIRQEIKIGQVSDGLDFHWHMLHWCQLAIQSVACLASVNSHWFRLLLEGLRGMPFFAIPTGEHAGAFFGVTPLDECTYDVHAVGDFPLASLRFFRLRSPFTADFANQTPARQLLGGRLAHEHHWPAQMDSPHPQAEGHCGSLWPRTQSTLQRHVPAPWSVREAASRCRVRYAGLVANLTLVRVTQHQGCMIQIVWCVAPFRQEALEGDTLQLTTQLFPALCALCPNRLQPDLLGVFAVSQLSHLPVPPCCALVDWPVGTPFTVYAYNDLLAVRAAHPPVTVGWPSWHLQLLNPSDWNDLPCPVLASCSWPVSLLMVKCVQAMRERSGHLECRSFVLADSQGAVASPASAVLRAFAPNANILLKMQ